MSAIDIDINFLYPGPLYRVDRMPSAVLGSYRAANVPVLDIHELVASKMGALPIAAAICRSLKPSALSRRTARMLRTGSLSCAAGRQSRFRYQGRYANMCAYIRRARAFSTENIISGRVSNNLTVRSTPWIKFFGAVQEIRVSRNFRRLTNRPRGNRAGHDRVWPS